MFVEEWMTVAANQRYCLQIWVVAGAFAEAFTEAFTEVAADIAADITVDIAAEVLVEVAAEVAAEAAVEIAAEVLAEIAAEVLVEAAGGLGHRLQIQLVVPVVQAWQGLEKMSWCLSWTGLRISSGTQELPNKL